MSVNIITAPKTPFIRVSGVYKWNHHDSYGRWDWDYGDPARDWVEEVVQPQWDFVRHMLENCLFYFGAVDGRELFGFSHPTLPRTERTFGSFKISTFPYKGRGADSDYPSNLLNSYALSIDSSSGAAKRLLSHDQMVVHHNMDGTAHPPLTANPHTWDVGTRVDLGTLLPSFNSANWSPYLTPANGLSYWFRFAVPATAWNLYEVWVEENRFPVGPGLPVLDYLKSVSGSYSQTIVSGSRLVSFSLENFNFSQHDRRIDWEYTFKQSVKIAGTLTSYDCRWTVRSGITLYPTGVTQDPYASQWFRPLGMQVSPYYEFDHLGSDITFVLGANLITLHKGAYSGLDAPYFDDVVARFGPYMESLPSLGSPDPRLVDLALVVEASDHGNFWEKELSELRKSSVYSFHNAIEKELLLLKNNYLEVLKEIPELPELIPDIVSLVRILSASDKANLLKTGVRLGDWVTKFNLQYNFGIAPDVSVLNELNRVGPQLLQLVRDGRDVSTKTVYGTFHFPFNSDECWGTSSKLITRSKVNFTYSPRPFWNAVMSLYGVRLLPSLQNIWELIPGSFVVDWFTNMSARYKHVDLSLLQLALQFNYLEHSYTITSGLPDDSSVWGYVGVGESRLQPKFYARDISFVVPQLSESKFDYLRVQGSPNLGILGSLLYQFLHLGG